MGVCQRGHSNPAWAQFCGQCGLHLDASKADSGPWTRVPPPGSIPAAPRSAPPRNLIGVASFASNWTSARPAVDIAHLLYLKLTLLGAEFGDVSVAALNGRIGSIRRMADERPGGDPREWPMQVTVSIRDDGPLTRTVSIALRDVMKVTGLGNNKRFQVGFEGISAYLRRGVESDDAPGFCPDWERRWTMIPLTLLAIATKGSVNRKIEQDAHRAAALRAAGPYSDLPSRRPGPAPRDEPGAGGDEFGHPHAAHVPPVFAPSAPAAPASPPPDLRYPATWVDRVVQCNECGLAHRAWAADGHLYADSLPTHEVTDVRCTGCGEAVLIMNISQSAKYFCQNCRTVAFLVRSRSG